VDLIRRPSEFERPFPGEPGIDVKLPRGSAKAELIERGDESLGVLPCGPDERVEILAVARHAVDRHGLTADDDEVHLVAIQAGAERLEVGFDLASAAVSR
jgi:hypothetical protein